MLVLDTDHFSEFERGTWVGAKLRERLRASDQAKAVTVVTAEEVMRGWLAHIHQCRDRPQSVEAYRRFQASLQGLVQVLDRLLDEVGENEGHPLVSLLEVVGVLVEKYEREHVPELKPK